MLKWLCQRVAQKLSCDKPHLLKYISAMLVGIIYYYSNHLCADFKVNSF